MYLHIATGNREATIIFKCDDNAGNGNPQLLSETLGCAVTFEWKTKFLCPPKKMECKFIQKHKTYDLRVLSSLTGSWLFNSNGIAWVMVVFLFFFVFFLRWFWCFLHSSLCINGLRLSCMERCVLVFQYLIVYIW